MIEAEHRTSNIERPTSNANPKYEVRNSKERRLGQYFTPRPVVELCYRMLQTLDPDAANPSIIDPACGEGAFLSCALENGVTTPDRLFGVEMDASIAQAIPAGRMNLFIGDGLASPESWSQCPPLSPSPPLRVPASPHPPLASADWVVGNPPFGTQGSIDSERIKADFTIWPGHGTRDLSRYPIEILFLERFIQLARPGGHIAIIIPDGILANERLSYVREWLWKRAEVKAVISLPQYTFHRHGASAKASVLVLRRRESVGVWECESVGVWEYGDSLRPCPHTPIHPHSPGDRLDPAYYHPEFVENQRFLEGLPNTVRLGDLIEFTTYGQVGSREYSESGVRLLTPANLAVTSEGLVTGVDIHAPERSVPEGSRNDPPRSRLRKGDLLLANSGVGCIGRAAVFYADEPCNISQHINLIRLRGIEPEYVAIYLQTRFGRLQIHREKCGVGACGINFNRIRSIVIPVLAEGDRREIVDGYRLRPIRELVKSFEELVRSQWSNGVME